MLENNISTSAANIVTDVADVEIEHKEPVNWFKRQDNDIDLVAHVAKIIETRVSTEAKDYFLKNPIVALCANTHSLVQRVNLNRFFIQILLRARSYLELENVEMVFSAIDMSGKHDKWIEKIEEVVVPYLAANKVFELFLEAEKEAKASLEDK